MDLSNLPEPLRNRIEDALTRPALDTVDKLLGSYVADCISMDEVRQNFQHGARSSFLLPNEYADLERVLAEPQVPGTLLWLVEGVIGWGIDDDPSDQGAAAVLREIADILREELEAVGRLHDYFGREGRGEEKS